MSLVEEQDASDPEKVSLLDDERRFKGPPALWQKYTAAERALAASLDDLQAADLSLHLYNTHAFKAKQYQPEAGKLVQPWEGKDTWFGERAQQWRPADRWSAWPLDIANVPRPRESFRNVSFSLRDPENTVCKTEPWSPRQDLEEQLLAILLNQSKEQLAKAQAQESRQGLQAEQHSPALQSSVSEQAHSVAIQSKQITSDDDQAHQLVSPCLDEILSKFDALLTALQKSRLGHIKSHNTPKGALQNRTLPSEDGTRHTEAWLDRSDRSEDESQAGEQAEQSIKRLSCRDWSEVLGIAGLIGWEHIVVQRAVARCSTLFGEDMVLRIMADPSNEAENNSNTYRNAKPLKKSATKLLHCPVDGCPRGEPFQSVKRIHEHLRRKHKWSVADCSQWQTAERVRQEQDNDSPKQTQRTAPIEPTFQLDYTALKRRKVLKS